MALEGDWGWWVAMVVGMQVRGDLLSVHRAQYAGKFRNPPARPHTVRELSFEPSATTRKPYLTTEVFYTVRFRASLGFGV